MSNLVNNETAEQFLKPALANLLQVYLKIMNEIDSEALVESFEKIVACYKDDMAPYAIEICTQLVE